MKKYRCLLLITILSAFIVGCGKIIYNPVEETPPVSTQLINPGDKIGDFLITTADDGYVFYISKVHCPFDNGTKTEKCEQPVGTKVNVGLGIYGDNAPGGKTVDNYWSDQTHEMFIEGRPVNLQAFGTIEYNTRREGRVRVWNVVIVAEKPGSISAHSSGVVGGDPFDYTAQVTFTTP